MDGLSKNDTAWIRHLARTMPFYRYIGMRLTKLSRGRAEMRIRVTKELTQDAGIAHGGVIAALVDSVIGLALWSLLKPTDHIVTVELKVNFLAPAKPGVVKAKGRILRNGRHIAVGIGEVRDHKGRLVATGTATYMTLFNRTQPNTTR